MTKWGSIKIRLEDILVVKRETFTDGRWFSGYCHQYRWGMEHTHSTCLNFYSQDMTRKFVSSSKSLICSGHFKIQMLKPPNGPKSSKKRAPFQSSPTFKPKKNISTKTVNLPTRMALNHRLILKLRFALKNPNSKRFGGSIKSSQILTKLCETIQYTKTPRPKVDQTTIISSFLRLPATFSQMNSTKSRRPC